MSSRMRLKVLVMTKITKSSDTPERFIEVPIITYRMLVDNNDFLDCLRAYGVDNWEGYEDAVESFHKERPND